MATIQHSNLTDSDGLHEPKGVATATSGDVYVADGAGSGSWDALEGTEIASTGESGGTKYLKEDGDNTCSWQLVEIQNLSATGQTDETFAVADGAGNVTMQQVAMGGLYFFNASTPSTVTYPSTYAKVAPTTAMTATTLFDNGGSNNGRLRYTGTETRHFHIAADVSVDQSSGAARDLQFALYKNGVVIANSEKIRTASSGAKGSIALHGDASLATNDYLEVYVQNNGASGDVNVYQVYLFAVGVTGT